MSYILEALQKSDTAATVTVTGPPVVSPAGELTLGWKLLIGAVLVANLLLAALLLSDRREPAVERAATPAANPAGAPATANERPPSTPSVAPPAAAPPAAAQAPKPRMAPPVPEAAVAAAPVPTRERRTLPGILEPRPLSAPSGGTPAVAAAVAAAARGGVSEPAPRPGAQAAVARAPAAPARRPLVELPIGGVQRLSQISPEVRDRLVTLNFSTHIWGEDVDLRAVVLNGERLVEGNQQGDFTLLRILEDGVIMQFDHAGTTQRVSIPVLEDWKEE